MKNGYPTHGIPADCHYKILREDLFIHKINYEELGHYLGLSRSSINNRFNCRNDWQIQEGYRILELLGRPESDLIVYFPKKHQP
jgi:hypothetical protein